MTHAAARTRASTVGTEAAPPPPSNRVRARIKVATVMHDRPHVLRRPSTAEGCCSNIASSRSSASMARVDQIPFDPPSTAGITMKMSQTSVTSTTCRSSCAHRGRKLDPSCVITHRHVSKRTDLYKTFRDTEGRLHQGRPAARFVSGTHASGPASPRHRRRPPPASASNSRARREGRATISFSPRTTRRVGNRARGPRRSHRRVRRRADRHR
jgi:hypothetical protein